MSTVEGVNSTEHAATQAAAEAYTPLVCVVDFHHARGPEIEKWYGAEENVDPAVENDWSTLPFMALSDGAHAAVEDLSYFTLRKAPSAASPATSLFGIACTRQIDSSELLFRSPEVTRSSVQKAVVAILDSPHTFAQIRERLSAATKAWFMQKDFRDDTILEHFHESLVQASIHPSDERDQYFGLSLREVVHEYKYLTLVLFKCLLLQPKMLFFGTNCERLCLLQFTLVSLIPGLIRNLSDCADPAFHEYEKSMKMSSSLRTSERASLLTYMGMPLQLFGLGAIFGPYTPLQQLDLLADYGTKSYVVGSTNALLLQQRDRYSDMIINMDTRTVEITSTSLRQASILTAADRRWIDFLTQAVQDTWDEANPTRPTTMGYAGSEEFLRLQFEEYLLALVSSVKYRVFSDKRKGDGKALPTETYGDPVSDFGGDWMDAWMMTDNYRLFSKFTDSHLFDIVEPRHPCAGSLTIEDIQRRLAQQVSELHLDERFNSSRETIGRHLATGQKKVSTAFYNLWSDIEAMREAQRQNYENEKAAAAAAAKGARTDDPAHPDHGARSTTPAPNDRASHTSSPSASRRTSESPGGAGFAQAQASVQAASSRAGAYLYSWGQWASEKRRTGWARSPSPAGATSSDAEPRSSIDHRSSRDL